MIQAGKLYISKTDSQRHAYIVSAENSYDEGMVFEYITEKDVRCRIPEHDFWAAYHKDDFEKDCRDEPVNSLRKAAKSLRDEFDLLKKENKELKVEFEKTKEELEQKKNLLDYSDKYILDLEELRKNNSDQIENYKKDLLHVVRSMREGS